ncbi:MAG: kelch repeat-containing protein [Deltaproteobacteria bacterium]
MTALAFVLGCAAAATPAGTAADVASSGAAEAASAARSTHLTTELGALTPRGLTTMGVTRMGGSLYVIGGYFGQPHNYSKEFQSADFTRLDVATGTWEQLPSAGALQSVILVNDGHYVYRVGGMRATNAAGEPENLQSVTEVARFDAEAKTWTALPSLPSPRSSHQAVIAEHTLYVVGGWALAGGSLDSTWADTLLSCDLSAPSCEWKSTPVPFKTRAMGAAVYHGKLYVTGGLTPEESTSDVWVGDLAAGTWSKGPALAQDNLTPTAGVWADQLFANGGDGNVYRLASDGQKWETAGALQFPRMFHQLVAGDDGLWVVGGVPGGKDRGARLRHVEHVVDKSSAGIVWTLRAQSPAKNRQGVFLQGQQLYVFGGNNSLEQHDFETKNFVDTALRLDLGALDWKPVEKFPVARQSLQSVVVGDDEQRTAYAVGGFGFANEHLATQPDVFSYDFQSRKWSKLGRGLPTPRSQFGLAEWSNALWVIGGLDYDDSRKDKEQFQHPTAVLRMDLREPAQGFSDAGFALREQRRAFAGALLGTRYYLTGGIHADFGAVTSCEVLDLEQKKSVDMACPSQQRLGGELVAVKGKLYLVGGSVDVSGKREPTSRVEVYDPATNHWSTLTEKLPLETPSHVRAFAFHDDLLLYSAQQQSANVQVALIHVDAVAAGAAEYASLRVTPTPDAPVPAQTAAVSRK